MLTQGGVALTDSADASRCYPDLWGNPAAARQAFHRARRVTEAAVTDPGAGCHAPLRRATYQRAGAGKRPAVLSFDPAAMPPDELRDWLEERVGPLARLEMEPPHDPPAPEPPGRPQALTEGPPAAAPAASGSAGVQAATGGDPRPLGGVHHPEAVPAAPAPSVALREAMAEQAVRRMRDRLALAALAERHEAVRPKRVLGVTERYWRELHAMAREAAGLPGAEWTAWRDTIGTAAAGWPPRPPAPSTGRGRHTK